MKTSTLQKHLEKAVAEKGTGLMTHMIVGYPSLDDNLRMLEAMAESGADAVELQFPFSEPVADGPVFVKANQEALNAGIKREDCFKLMERAARDYSFALLMMGYYNTVYKMGEVEFLDRLQLVGAKGLIVPDLPPHEGMSLKQEADKRDLSWIQLISPNTTLERKKEICASASGMVYCVARKGVTGKKTHFGDGLEAYMNEVRQATNLPIALGFGVRSPEDFKVVAKIADIAVVGTAGLEAYEKGGAAGLKELLRFGR